MSRTALLLTTVAILSLGATAQAQVQNAPRMPRDVSGTYQTPQGTGSYQTTVTPNEDGTTSVDTTNTLPNGVTVTNNRTVTRVENGVVVNGERTGPHGTSTYTNTVNKTGDGQWQGTREVTGPNGQTRTINTTGQRTDNGWQKTQTWTDPQGHEHSRNVDWQRNGNGTATKTVTTPNGNTRTMTFSNGHGMNGHPGGAHRR